MQMIYTQHIHCTLEVQQVLLDHQFHDNQGKDYHHLSLNGISAHNGILHHLLKRKDQSLSLKMPISFALKHLHNSIWINNHFLILVGA